VKLQAGLSGVQLEIERRRLYRLLLITGEFGEAVRESVGN